jgi:hypothetical protein
LQRSTGSLMTEVAVVPPAAHVHESVDALAFRASGEAPICLTPPSRGRRKGPGGRRPPEGTQSAVRPGQPSADGPRADGVPRAVVIYQTSLRYS